MLMLSDAAPGLPLRRLPWWTFAGFALLAGGALLAVGLSLPGRWSVIPLGGGTLAVHWKFLPPALALAFALPIFLGRLLSRASFAPALACTLAAAAVAGALVGNLRPNRLGGGPTLLAIATGAALIGGVLALIAADGLERLLWPRPRA